MLLARLLFGRSPVLEVLFHYLIVFRETEGDRRYVAGKINKTIHQVASPRAHHRLE
jgi:hypothetical protein